MKLRKLVVACIAAYAYLASAGAATDPKPAVVAPLSAQQIVDRNVAARGGLEAWKRVQTMSIAGKLDAGKRRVDGGRIGVKDRKLAKAMAKAELQKAALGKTEADADKVIQLPFTMEMKRPRQTRVEVEFQGKTAVQVYDGANGWKLRPFLGRHEVEAFNTEELKAASQQQDLDGPLIDYAAKGNKVALVGPEKVENRDAYKLALTLKGGEERNVWIDAKTFLEIKMEGAPKRWDGKLRPVTTWFREYKTVDGLVIPSVVETRVEGARDSERILVERVALNPPLDSARFAKPE